MKYSIKEIYYTLQGEGYHTGRPAVFIRFSGCNLWTGHEKDRDGTICNWCDTDFVGTNGINGGKFSVGEIINIINSLWKENLLTDPYVVFALERAIITNGRFSNKGYPRSGL